MIFARLGGLVFGLSVVASAVGCGSVVTHNDGEGGEGGEGGTIVIPPNPPGCPGSSPELNSDCQPLDGTCTYLEDGCAVGYTCSFAEDCWEYECESYNYWTATSATCSPPAVECEDAAHGDRCALPGSSCGWGDECSYEYKDCLADHTWAVSYEDDECCYDECCYDECWCDPYYCPEQPPTTGDYCDPCYDASQCFYEVETPCGVFEVFASCGDPEYAWTVDELPGCKEPEPEPG